MAKLSLCQRVWQSLKRPAPIALGLVLLIGFTSGIVLLGGVHTSLEMGNSEAFCLNCHEMRDNAYREYKTTIHYSNRSGIQADCADCHVPKEFVPKVVRKVHAVKELYGKITGKIATREKFVEHRRAMAQREWARMKANDSQECRNCHQLAYMDYTEQASRAMEAHKEAQQSGQTCIECHKGIAHKLPNMDGIKGWD